MSCSPATCAEIRTRRVVPAHDVTGRVSGRHLRSIGVTVGTDWLRRWTRATASPRLLVVGGASLDRIHVDGAVVATPGGAGLYTALAAARAGAEVTMLAPFPDPMPPELAPALDRLRWVGPTVPVEGLPRFEIAYDADGEVRLFEEHLGAEPDLDPAMLDLVHDLPGCAFCVPFMDAILQRRFVDALRARGVLTATNTYGRAVRTQRDTVVGTFDLADLTFCNTDEERHLHPDGDPPPTGHLRFVTRGRNGATVFQGGHRTEVGGVAVTAIDPTGAGDTFCGTVIARLLLGDHPVEAARRGAAAAASTVSGIGPAALFGPGTAPLPPPDRRVVVDDDAVARTADLVARLGDLRPFDFTGPLLPPGGDPGAVAWFTAATLQQFGFWFDVDGIWDRSMIAPIDGTRRKGSDYLWAAYRRWATDDPQITAPHRQAALTPDEWRAAVSDDEGRDPFPRPDLCVGLANSFGTTLGDLGLQADDLVGAAAAAERPMRTLLTLLDHIGGYREDPFRKKSALLGVVLRQRPERFLPSGPTDDDAPPIVDYHVQRTALRTGMVTIAHPSLAAAVAARRLVGPDDETAVRRATAEAVAQLCRHSGCDMGTVDWFLFSMRNHCPEATEPDCGRCPADPACAHRTDLFQPVLRTTAY